jgi:hypothetical protein
VTLEIIGLLFRGTNIFQLGLGIMLIILSLKDIGVSNLRWILELARTGFPRKKDDIISSVHNFLILIQGRIHLKIIALEKVRKKKKRNFTQHL